MLCVRQLVIAALATASVYSIVPFPAEASDFSEGLQRHGDALTGDGCWNSRCVAVDGCPDGYVDASGCCPVCQKVLKENEPCEPTGKTPDDIPAARCAHGFSCKMGACRRNNDPASSTFELCPEKRERRLLLRQRNIIADEAWIPECDARGAYAARQCKSHKCVCVDEDGKTIHGQAELHESDSMTCDECALPQNVLPPSRSACCSRQMTAQRRQGRPDWMAAPQVHCDSRGDFQRLQCRGTLCYCARRDTGEPTGPLVLIQHLALLSCYDAALHGSGYLTACERELVRMRSLALHFSRKGHTVLGLDGVACELDGSFARVQCGRPESCVCTDRDGISLKSYARDRMEFQGRWYGMDCDCALDENDHTRWFANLPKWSCDQYGSFRRVQHPVRGYCLCVEPDGSALRPCPGGTSPAFTFSSATDEEFGDVLISEQRTLLACSETDVDIYCAQPDMFAEAVCRWRREHRNATY